MYLKQNLEMLGLSGTFTRALGHFIGNAILQHKAE